DPQPPEHWAELHEQIERLPSPFRLPIVLCYLEGLTHAEAAQQLGLPLGTVESRLARGRVRLRERLTSRGLTVGIFGLGAAPLPAVARAAVPAACLNATAHFAVRFGRGEKLAALVSGPVATMTREMLWRLGWHQLKLVSAGILAAAIVASGAVAMFRPQSA